MPSRRAVLTRPTVTDGVQDDQQVEEEAAVEQETAQESSGFTGQGPFSPNLKGEGQATREAAGRPGSWQDEAR
jgi:hypothetical protein